MSRNPSGISLLLALALAAASCGKEGATVADGVDSTSTGETPESTAVEPGTVTAAVPDTLMRLTYAERRGMRLFSHYCVVCHGDQGAGDGFNAYNLDPPPRDLTDAAYQDAISDETLKEVVAQGGRGMNKSILMPAYGQTLSREQIEDLVAYLRTLAPSAGRDGDDTEP